MLQKPPESVAERFTEVLDRLKRDRKLKSQGMLALKAGKSISILTEIKGGRQNPSKEILDVLEQEYQINLDYILDGTGGIYQGQEMNEPVQPYTNIRRGLKIEENPYLVPFVDVPALAGYSKVYQNRDYIGSLKKFPMLPGVDPTGAVWQYFEIDGDSMEPEFLSGDTLLCSQVHPEDWPTVRDFHTHVIVTETAVFMKDVYKASEKEWWLLSQNEHHKPFSIMLDQIKQVWVMRRHIKARAKKHRMYDLKQIKKELK